MGKKEKAEYVIADVNHVMELADLYDRMEGGKVKGMFRFWKRALQIKPKMKGEVDTFEFFPELMTVVFYKTPKGKE